MENENRICPDCGREKASNVDDVKAGYCPKWWAIRDPDAEKDCLENPHGGQVEKGVSWYKKSKKFMASITFNNKQIYLGLFNVLGDADSACRKAEEKYFGEFARNNENKTV